MRRAEDLRGALRKIDGKGYKSYKSVAGGYRFKGFELFIDHVQGDPFADPSRLRVRLPAAEAGFPEWATSSAARRVALADYLTRAFAAAVSDDKAGRSGTGKSGLITIEEPRQEVLPRTSVVLGDKWLEARFAVGLPAQGRRILGKKAASLLCDELPRAVTASLRYASLDSASLAHHLEAVEDQQALRDALAERHLVAFVGDGSILPRKSGVDPRPMGFPREDRSGSLPRDWGRPVIPFESPPELAVEIDVPNLGRVRGMGIPEGVTLIVGGGYHGKSTLLSALELSVYDHVPEDGRELVTTRADAVKIRAEDGRRVEGVDISPFIDNLPFDEDTRSFSSDDASGSTSQAAAIVEALEMGARVLLIDEDTSATNFMIRDHRMQALVAKEKEPITPFIDRVRQLWEERGVSSVIVVGGSGDYFDVADTVIQMDEYRPRDVTAEAREIAERFAKLRLAEGGDGLGELRARVPQAASLDSRRGRRQVHVDVKGLHTIRFGGTRLDLSAVEQLVEVAQTRAVARALVVLKEKILDGELTLPEALDRLEEHLEREGLDYLARGKDGGLAYARRFEIAAALNRLRVLEVLST